MLLNNPQICYSHRSQFIAQMFALAILPFGFALAQATQAQEFQAVKSRLDKSVSMGEITESQAIAMMKTLEISSPKSCPTLNEAMRSFATNNSIVRSSYHRLQNVMIEHQHFQKLQQNDIETLDVALDAMRRRWQAKIAFDSALHQHFKSLAAVRKQLNRFHESDEVSKPELIRQLREIEKQANELQVEIGAKLFDELAKDEARLAAKNLKTSEQALAAALKTWRTIKRQYDDGKNVTIQNVAQAAEQYHFFDSQFKESHELWIQHQNR